MSERLDFASEAVVQAGRLTLPYFRERVPYELKSDESPITIADREAEALIRRRIAAAFPEDAIVGEEQGGDLSSQDCWLIDPIDGTKSFICGVPLFATLLAYCKGGVPLVGVAYFPALEVLAVAERGKGAYENGERMQVSTRNSLQNSILCCGSNASFMKIDKLESLLEVSQNAMTLRTWCDAYGHYLVASGRADAMIDPIVQPWDIGPMQVIVEESGGEFTDFSGSPNPRNQAIASNGLLHSELVGAFQ